MPVDTLKPSLMPRSRVLTLGLLTAVLASGYGVMFTVLDDFRDDYGINESMLGVIVGIGFFSSFLAQILIAPVADRGHARKLLVAAMLVTVVGLLGMAWATTLVPLLTARFVMGLGIGAAVPAVRRIVIVGDPDNLGTNLGLLLSADVTGFAAGPAVSAVLVPAFGLAAPFLAIAGATVACLPVVLAMRVDEAAVPDVGAAVPARFAFDLFASRPFVAIAFMGAAVFMMIGTFDALWAVVLADLDASDLVANLGISVFALPLIFLGATGGRLAQRVGPFRLGTLGILIGAGFMFLYGVMPTGGAMLAIGIVHAVFDGLTVASSGVATALVVPGERQASAQGMIGAVETLVGAATAILAGVLYDFFGRVTAYTVCAATMVSLAAVAWWLAGPQWRARRVDSEVEPLRDPAAAVTGHA